MLDARPSRLLLRGQSIASLIFFENQLGFCSVLPTGHLHWRCPPNIAVDICAKHIGHGRSTGCGAVLRARRSTRTPVIEKAAQGHSIHAALRCLPASRR